MPAEALVVLLPSRQSTAVAAEATVESIVQDLDAAVRIAAYQEHPAVQIPTVKRIGREDVLAASPILAFARPGDTWCAGAFAARLRTLTAHPTARLSVAGYRLVGADGQTVLRVRPPVGPLGPAEFLIRPRAEASAVLVHAAALDSDALALLERPHGDAVVWNRVAQEHGYVRSAEIAANVPLDPDRHGYSPEATTSALREALLASDWPEGPEGAALRREFLRRLFLDPDPDLDEPVDFSGLVGDANGRAATLIDDLQWALTRQREALEAERVQWPERASTHFEQAPNDDLADDQIERLQREVDWLHEAIATKDAALNHLHAEILLRDATVSHLHSELLRRRKAAP